MTTLNKIIRNPIVTIFISPFAGATFGLLAGAKQQGFDWQSFVLIYAILIIIHLLDHHFFIQYNLRQARALPMNIVYGLEILLLILGVIFMLTHHWVLTILMMLYLGFVHVQYFPHNITQTPYHIVLSVFFYAIVLNAVAYFSQAKHIELDFIGALFPVTLVLYAIQNAATKQRELLMRIRPAKWIIQSNIAVVSIAGVGLLIAAYMSLPTQSFFIMQILFIAITGAGYLPLIIDPAGVSQHQNKLNYLHFVYFIFSLLYGLSYIF
ncbi:MAG: hypothetical protein Q4A10_02860 [Aerococcaceae bacterium]|nr:hypothetical protein [Aerococcaceae bacterium]